MNNNYSFGQDLPALITLKYFCKKYSVSHATLYRMREKGIISFVKVGRSSRIKSADAQAWFNSLPKAE